MSAFPPPLAGFMEPSRPLVTGLDLSLTYTGIATVRTDGSIDVSAVRSSGHRDDDLHTKAIRFDNIAEDILDEVPRDAELVVIESPAYGMPQGAVDLGGLRWLVLTRLVLRGFDVSEVSPSGLKKYATEKGNADKDVVLATVVKRYPQADVTNNNTADAVVLAALGARHLGHPVDEITVLRQVAYDKVRWSA